ncbi:hypothetical protein FQN54_001126 [Arachnomyces sp. PD_36]|nr:hypothetical protein FQN54_001126 [Arachnomyces sp. PD_36]
MTYAELNQITAMPPANDNEQLMGSYAGLQRSKTKELHSLIYHAGVHETSGHSNALSPLSKIVKERYQGGEVVVTLEELEHAALQWYTRKGKKPGFECLHVAFVRLQGHEIHINDERLGILLDWVFYGPDVVLILGNGGYVCQQRTVNEMIELLCPDSRVGLETVPESQ